ncbi:DUF5658 family protein [Paenibacillus oryzisoli]|uniref:DUF5658 family protein n=1 Tax=Paenibacillus oryzisoli TaxID=1850517 RepID=UPI003D2D49BE
MRTMTLLLKNKILLCLLLLCLGDALFTDMGLKLRFIEEMNPLIRSIYEWHVAGYYAIKLVFPLALMIIHPRIRQKPWVHPALLLTVILYGAVNVYHVVWMSMAFNHLAAHG